MITRLRSWSKTHQGRKLIRYTLVSGSSTVVSFLALSAFYGLNIIPSVIWSTLAGNLVASVPAYQLNRRWTWGKRGKSQFRREVVPFWALTFLGIGVSQLGALWARHEVKAHHWSHLANTGLVVATNLASFAIFWVLKLIVFNRIFHVDTVEEIDEHLNIEEVTGT
ncbi:MAG: GtrA family protein [Acidimicrobiales bacterium]